MPVQGAVARCELHAHVDDRKQIPDSHAGKCHAPPVVVGAAKHDIAVREQPGGRLVIDRSLNRRDGGSKADLPRRAGDNVDLGSADVVHRRAVHACDIGSVGVDDVRVDHEQFADSETDELLAHRRPGASGPDNADSELSENELPVGAERSDLPVELCTKSTRASG